MDVLPSTFSARKPADVSVVGVNYYNAGHLLDQMFAALEAARARCIFK
jgi:hypothetical protein